MALNFFVSYSRVDTPFAEDLIHLLRKVYGQDAIWFDNELCGGSDWWREILAQIETCDAFIYLITNESLQSEYCKKEYAEAARLQKPVIPVLIRSRVELPQHLQQLQHVDMTNGFRSAEGINDLHAAINHIVKPPPPKPDYSLEQKVSVAQRFIKTELAGIVNHRDLLERARREIIVLSKYEENILVENFDEVFYLACEFNQKSLSQRQGEFVFCGHSFFYNGGTWEVSQDNTKLSYFGHGIAWTEKKYSLLKNKVIIQATAKATDPVFPDDGKQKDFEFCIGITLNAHHWPNKQADAVTIASNCRFSAIRPKVYAVSPKSLTFTWNGYFDLDRTYEVLAELSMRHFSLRIPNEYTTIPPVELVHVDLLEDDIRWFNIPLHGHIGLFSWGMENNEISSMKVELSNFKIIQS